MPLLSAEEAVCVSDSFLMSLYGSDVFRRWKEVKDDMQFFTEREYVSWLLDVACHYKSVGEGGEEQGEGDEEASYNQMHDTDSRHGLKHTNSKTDEAGHTYNHSLKPEAFEVEEEVASIYVHQPKQESDVVLVQDDRENDVPTTYNRDLVLHNSDYDGYWPGSQNTSDVTGEGRVKGRKEKAKKVSVAGKDKDYTCQYCNNTFNSKTNLLRHISGVHEKKKPFSCPHCTYCSAQKPQLKQHLIYRHGYDSDYQCGACGKSFAVPSHLESHKATCQGSKPARILPPPPPAPLAAPPPAPPGAPEALALAQLDTAELSG